MKHARCRRVQWHTRAQGGETVEAIGKDRYEDRDKERLDIRQGAEPPAESGGGGNLRSEAAGTSISRESTLEGWMSEGEADLGKRAQIMIDRLEGRK